MAHEILIAAALAVTLAASLVEEFQKGKGPRAEGLAIDAVLRLGAGLSATAALLLFAGLPAASAGTTRRPGSSTPTASR